jgi:DNA-binding NarL/FixJ family response regulator
VASKLIVITTVALTDGPINAWLAELRKRSTPTFVFVVMDAAHRSTVKSIVDAGAQAVLLQANIGKGVLLEALEALEGGQRYLDHECRLALDNPATSSDELSARELEILEMVAEGLTNKEIAKQLVIAEVTARDHVQNILRKLRVENRTAAVLAGIRHGYLHWLNI